MMNYEDIKQEIIDNWNEIDGEDGQWLSEAVDSALPIYYSDIIEQWTKMPNEFDESWQDIVATIQNHTITSLMSIDLWVFTQSKYNRAYREIEEEKEAND